MSTVLRALQKVEKDPANISAPAGSTYSLRPSYTISRKIKMLWYLQMGKRFIAICASLAAVALIIVAGIYFMGQNSAGDSKTSMPPPKDSLAHAVPSPSKNLMAQNGGPSRPKSYSPKPTYDPNHHAGSYYNSNTAEASQKPVTVIEPQHRKEPPLEMENLAAYDDEDEVYDDSEEDLPPEVEAPQEPFEVLESDPEEVRYAQLDLLDNGKLQLQAISYAETPSQRMAVINNEIVREGRNIEGYKIIYIGPEQVVVEQRGTQWKIIFMNR